MNEQTESIARIPRGILAHPTAVGVLLTVGAVIGLSSKSIFIKLIYSNAPDIDAIGIMVLRMLFAMPIFLLASAVARHTHRDRPLARGDYVRVLAMAISGYYFASLLNIAGLAHISAGLERMILYLYPTMVVLIMAVQKRQGIGLPRVIGMAVSYGGIALVFLDQVRLNGDATVLGSVLVFGSAVSFAIYTVGGGALIARIGSVRFTAYTTSLGSLFTFGHYAAQHGLELPVYSARVYGLALVLAVVATTVPMFMMSEGIRRLGADTASLLGTVGPIATIIMGAMVLGESVTGIQVAGTAMILAGVTASTRKRR